MKVEQVDIRNFRNHGATSLECGDGLNILLGENGQGKTNIIEAIAYLSLTKSFYASNDGVVLRLGEERFDIEGRFIADSGSAWIVHASYEKEGTKKTIEVNKEPAQSLASVVGQFPVVVLSPEQNGITFGPPTERRKFLDLALAQASKVYLVDLLEYRRILRQRNKILLDAKLARKDCSDLLEPWDASLIQTGSKLIERRRHFVKRFEPKVRLSYEALAPEGEEPGVQYAPSFSIEEDELIEDVEERFKEELRLHAEEERRTGSTVVGPHRDDLKFSIEGKDLRRFASQGQHKTFLVALKLAEFAHLIEAQSETPLLLLDDVFSELDEGRSSRLLEAVAPLSQVFITTTDERLFHEAPGRRTAPRKHVVRQGRIFDVEPNTIIS